MARNTPAVFFALASSATATFAFTTTITTTSTHATPSNHYENGRNARGASILYAENNNGLSKKAYNDDALFNFHMMTQRQKIRNYSALDSYVNTQSLWNLAWHDSFVRNGLSDFVPPMIDEINVLVVGTRYQGPTGGGEIVVKEEDINDTPMIVDGMDDSAAMAEGNKLEGETASNNLIQKTQDSSCSFLAAISDNTKLSKDESSELSKDEGEIASYDCIMDQGLIADLCGDNINDNKTKEDIARLLFEATKRIREMGIYVANTPPMSPQTKQYLHNLGQLLGLQWEFDLDGISDDKLCVSVARKFGSVPKIGWQKMARLIEE